MPIYVYRCRSCEAQHEVVQQIREAPLTVCRVLTGINPDDGQPTECGGELFKVVQPMDFKLQGRGFHNTDYRAGSRP